MFRRVCHTVVRDIGIASVSYVAAYTFFYAAKGIGYGGNIVTQNKINDIKSEPPSKKNS